MEVEKSDQLGIYLEGKTRKTSCWIPMLFVRESEKSMMTPGFWFEWLEWKFPFLIFATSRWWSYEWYLTPCTFKIPLYPKTTFLLYIFYWNIVDAQWNVTSVSGVQYSDSTTLYCAVLTTGVAPIGHRQHYCSAIDYILYAVPSPPWFIHSVTKSLYLPLSFTPFCPFPHPIPPSGSHQFVLCIYGSLSASCVHLFCLDSTYKWNHLVFVFLCVTYFT